MWFRLPHRRTGNGQTTFVARRQELAERVRPSLAAGTASWLQKNVPDATGRKVRKVRTAESLYCSLAQVRPHQVMMLEISHLTF